MRHQKVGRRLGRTSQHRRAMFRNMANSLVHFEVIKTTLPKAKELRRIVEPLVTISKKDILANRRLVFSYLRDRKSLVKLFDKLGERFKNRKGGYTRVLKSGFRTGDRSPMAYIEFVDRIKKSK